ncbi:hypothetical protein CYLTODRAFT_109675 [Cylindrobasidium torrendii FP15055 ss-10]|uniref:Uncharacterized protein n=1 Tax=Cylindrobasidium torrendii FP15055 ss-10 TaxID=1314674 RepID=A0A0D7BN47_9AGAR|nr:hypothetical protein CYLTODRAFT_109675 [Cylindrobasidium torrendii FP15055 ss-10]
MCMYAFLPTLDMMTIRFSFERTIRTARNKMLDHSPNDPAFPRSLANLTNSIVSSMNQVESNMLTQRYDRVTEGTKATKSSSISETARNLVEAEEALGRASQRHGVLVADFWAKLRRVIAQSSNHFTLARAVEEPPEAKCDAVAGIRLQCFDEEDKERVDAFNSVIYKDAGATQKLSDGLPTLSNVFSTKPEDKERVGELAGGNPFSRSGVPDEKVLADLLTQNDDDLSPVRNLGKRREIRSMFNTSTSNANPDVSIDHGRVHPSPYLDIILQFYSAEHKRKNGSVFQSVGQAQIYLHSAVAQNVAVGIGDAVVFCLVTNGPIGIVLSAWSVSANSLGVPYKNVPPDTPITFIAMRNPPKFDIREPNQALRFATFLLHLQHVHAPRLAKRFNNAREAFAKRWHDDDTSLRWTMKHQQESSEHKARFAEELDNRDKFAALNIPASRLQAPKSRLSLVSNS